MTDANHMMDLAQVRISQLIAKDSVRQFKCGEREIDSWIASKATKWCNQNRSKVFFAHNAGNDAALGLYSLSFSVEDRTKLGEQAHRDRYPDGFPILYIDYLAVKNTCQSNGLGKILLIDALKRSHWISNHVAFYGVGLRSLNDRTTDYYKKFGFGIAPNEEKNPLMIIDIWTMKGLFEAK